jgi:NAD-dependent SIR2 family protein deacetylase
MKNIHNNQEEVKCDKCGNKFKNENGLKSHIKLVHNTEKTKCEYCDKEIRNYKYHLKIVHNM